MGVTGKLHREPGRLLLQCSPYFLIHLLVLLSWWGILSRDQMTILCQETQVKEKEGPVRPEVEKKVEWSCFQGNYVQAIVQIRALVIGNELNGIQRRHYNKTALHY